MQISSGHNFFLLFPNSLVLSKVLVIVELKCGTSPLERVLQRAPCKARAIEKARALTKATCHEATSG